MLIGKHLVLRAIRREDLGRLNDFANNCELCASSSSSPYVPVSLDETRAEYERYVAEACRNRVRFVIEFEGSVIGECGLSGLSESRGVTRSCDLNIVIGEQSLWGRGLGKEVIELLLRYAFECINLERVGLRTSSENKRALACFVASGFIEEGRLRNQEWKACAYHDRVYMSVLRSEWLAKMYGPSEKN
jgi:RimJ/RimL family protein N-acetyltransferase